MKCIDTNLLGVKVIEPKVFGDSRGFFLETFREDWFKSHCENVDFVQDNHSKSKKGILRGMHYQTKHTQGKLVRVTQGEVYDVVIDMRQDSPTFSQWYGIHLSAQNHRQLWVPAGFAHGFLVLSDVAEFVYKCTDYYDPCSEVSIKYNDPVLGIKWPLSDSEIHLSDKDKQGQNFIDAPRM
ncbi:dTDP-4-dehydrorhamnose 3,5-epimerase [Alteromonas sp. ASW11-36]|uniref:dTDP-4-dehydrorhamnose 3,5-epimerase n=1 Tax=Alteromonas arenosi TaxID=3055817 RepID=A0ABT7T0L3_9ALTE|nr:dTDP-4-dehydrorhamnose 3,5-epimerase [Alteromonas sp. ASW11-36]MDM7861981.1 dTDP-4-dehydrorhamnose 3,5-epimerase [Alteromonas sp. ASW11-36]